MLVVTNNIQVPLREISFTYARASGPGGQNVNKVNSKATLRWNIEKTDSIKESVKKRFRAQFGQRISTEGELVIHSDRFRDQARNVADCLEKLRSMLSQVAKPPKRRIATKPSKNAVKSRLDGKKQHGEKKKLRKKIDY